MAICDHFVSVLAFITTFPNNIVNCLCCLSRVFTQSRPPQTWPSSPQTSARQLPGLVQSSGPQPDNSTLFSPLLLEAVIITLYMMFRLRRLQSAFNSLCTSCVARNIESALGLGHHDGLIRSQTSIKLVLSNSSENPNSFIGFWYGRCSHLFFRDKSQFGLRIISALNRYNSRRPESQQHCLLIIKEASRMSSLRKGLYAIPMIPDT